jgi:hypothetical protein
VSKLWRADALLANTAVERQSPRNANIRVQAVPSRGHRRASAAAISRITVGLISFTRLTAKSAMPQTDAWSFASERLQRLTKLANSCFDNSVDENLYHLANPSQDRKRSENLQENG